MRDINQITGEIVDAAYQLHSRLGPGLVEKVYETILERSLIERGLSVERQKQISFAFDGMQFDGAFCVDLLVEGQVVVELKSVEKLSSIHHKQILTYLRVLDLPIGLLINFGNCAHERRNPRIANPRASSAQRILSAHR